MGSRKTDVKSVAVIGAGAAGAIAISALAAENYFEHLRVFERRESAGGTWIHDVGIGKSSPIQPGVLPPELDRPLDIPRTLPAITQPCQRNRWSLTPIYNSLTTNVPDIAMSFSDSHFPYGPFVPHYVARQYVESYFATHRTDTLLEVNTTLEDLAYLPERKSGERSRWRLILRKFDATRHIDVWWEEFFDAVILANGHYSVPYVPQVDGLQEYIETYPNRVSHSKTYRSPLLYQSKRVIVIGNSASGHDISQELVTVAQQPVYLSRRSKAKWESDEPPPGIVWKPTIKEFSLDGSVVFTDGTIINAVDAVIYCTGYKASFPFWNEALNGGPLWDYTADRIRGSYLHTFFRKFPTLGIVGLPRTLTFRSFEYQAIALARVWSNRNSIALPPASEQKAWEIERAERTSSEHKKFHDIPWENGETDDFLDRLFQISGLGTLHGDGRIPPVLSKDMVWAIEHIQKYPDPKLRRKRGAEVIDNEDEGWLLVNNVLIV